MIENMKKQKNVKRILLIVVVIALIIGATFVALNILNKNKIVGYYELYEMTAGNENYTHEEVEGLKAFNLNVTLELNKDKTGTINLFNNELELTYNSKNMTIDGETYSYYIQNNNLTLDLDNSNSTNILNETNGKLVFQKAEKSQDSE